MSLDMTVAELFQELTVADLLGAIFLIGIAFIALWDLSR